MVQHEGLHWSDIDGGSVETALGASRGDTGANAADSGAGLSAGSTALDSRIECLHVTSLNERRFETLLVLLPTEAMTEPRGGENLTQWEALQQVLTAELSAMNDLYSIGVVAYPAEPVCSEPQVLVPIERMAAEHRQRVIDTVRMLTPRAVAPLASTLETAMAEYGRFHGDRPRQALSTMLLGIESLTAVDDACAAATPSPHFIDTLHGHFGEPERVEDSAVYVLTFGQTEVARTATYELDAELREAGLTAASAFECSEPDSCRSSMNARETLSELVREALAPTLIGGSSLSCDFSYDAAKYEPSELVLSITLYQEAPAIYQLTPVSGVQACGADLGWWVSEGIVTLCPAACELLASWASQPGLKAELIAHCRDR